MLMEDIPQPEDGFYVLITGANSGLGFAIGCRLIDEFLPTRPQSQELVLIITTRDKRKGDATVEKLRRHLNDVCRKSERKMAGVSMLLQRRVHFRQEILDLTSLVSVQKLARRLRDTTPKLDAVILNAGIGGWTGLYWGSAIWGVLTSWKTAVTWPHFKKSGIGWTTKPQLPPTEDGSERDQPSLGDVFCANFFGHYLLGHYLAPLLANHSPDEESTGRLIWVSSLEAYTDTINLDDIQSIKSTAPYESSKRLTDLISITSTFPSTASYVETYFDTSSLPTKSKKPRMYVTHPGICGTSILPLNIVLQWAMFAAFYIARWLGSQWHGVTADKGATAPVWVALVKQSMLDAMEEREGVGKWGSATDWWGQEMVERTEVEGWGWGGKLNEKKRKGRSPYAKDLTKEDRENFEETGRVCWQEMEKLRVEWEERLQDAGVAIELD